MYNPLYSIKYIQVLVNKNEQANEYILYLLKGQINASLFILHPIHTCNKQQSRCKHFEQYNTFAFMRSCKQYADSSWSQWWTCVTFMLRETLLAMVGLNPEEESRCNFFNKQLNSMQLINYP